jgi:hypothetical protein
MKLDVIMLRMCLPGHAGALAAQHGQGFLTAPMGTDSLIDRIGRQRIPGWVEAVNLDALRETRNHLRSHMIRTRVCAWNDLS